MAESSKTGYPILCLTRIDVEVIKEKAREQGVEIPEPIIYNKTYRLNVDNVLIDEIDVFLSNVLHTKVCAVTLTSDEFADYVYTVSYTHLYDGCPIRHNDVVSLYRYYE